VKTHLTGFKARTKRFKTSTTQKRTIPMRKYRKRSKDYSINYIIQLAIVEKKEEPYPCAKREK